MRRMPRENVRDIAFVISKFNLLGEKGEKYSTVTPNQLTGGTMKAVNNMEKTYSCHKSISIDKTIQYLGVAGNSV